MSGEVSYFSRFFVKFVEIIAAGLASAISAYLLAHFGGLLSSPTPASPPALTAVQLGPNASGVAPQPTPPVAAAATKKNPSEVKLARETGKDAKVLSPRKFTKTDTDLAEKEPRSQKSAEALVRAALANVDANTPADAQIGPSIANTRSAPVDAEPGHASVPARQADRPPPVDVPALKTMPDAAVTDPQRAPADVRSSSVTSVEIEPRPVAALDPSLPSASPPLEKAAAQASSPADQNKQVRAGVLTCDVSAGMGLILGSQKQVSCSFSPEGDGTREDYYGSITKFGLDLGLTRGSRMLWVVFTNTVAGPGFLAGDYYGATGEATVVAGVGANILVGGSNRTVALQPISLSGQTGLNLAIGVAALQLGLP